MKRTLWLLSLLLAVTPAGLTQEVDEDGFLQWTQSVGVMLNGYHVAYEVAAEAIAAHGVMPPLYAAGPYDGGWAFSFGDLEPDGTFVLDFGVIVAADESIARFEIFDFRRIASNHHTLAARALQVVRRDFEEMQLEVDFPAEEYRIAVMPFPRGHLTAFVSPRQTNPGYILAGNALMYRLDRGSAEIQARTRLHHDLLPLPDPRGTGSIPVLIVPDAPLPSPVDVLNAVEHRTPLLVLAAAGAFEISPDGTLTKLAADDDRTEMLRDLAGR